MASRKAQKKERSHRSDAEKVDAHWFGHQFIVAGALSCALLHKNREVRMSTLKYWESLNEFTKSVAGPTIMRP